MKRRSHPKRILRIINEVGKEVSHNNEVRVLHAYTKDYPFPDRMPWIKDVRLANEQEDQRGIDLIFSTDVGDLLLQLKSSQGFADKFVREKRERKLRTDIVVAVTDVHHQPRDICKIITPLLANERNRRLRLKRSVEATYNHSEATEEE